MAPGLQKLHISQQSLKSTVSNAVATTTRSTVASSGMSSRANTSIFPTGSMGGGRSFGIMAQRSAAGSGTIYNAKAYYGESLTQQGIELNRQSTHVFNNIGNFSNMGPQVQQNNSMNKFAMALMATKALTGLAGEIISLTKSEGAGGAKAAGSTSNADSNTPASLNEMKGAKDSSTLRGAIESAKTEKTKMESELKELEGKLPDLKTASEAATKKLEELKPKVDAKQKEVDSKESEVKQGEENVKQGKSNLEACDKRLQSCDTAFKDASKELATAEKGLNSAERTLASTPETITTTDSLGNTTTKPNPKYAEAKQAVEQAKAQVKAAEAKKQEAAGTLEQAKQEKNTAKENYLTTQENLKQTEADLDKAKGELKELNSQLNELKEQQSAEQKKVDEYENALKDQKQLQSNIKSLDSEIPSQEKRLSELEQKEEKGLGAAESTILQMRDKMSGKDGISGTGDDEKLNKKDQDKYDSAKDLQRNVSYTKLFKTAGQVIGNKTFRTGSYNGETLYMIGSKKVDEAEYNSQIKRANGQSSGQSVTHYTNQGTIVENNGTYTLTKTDGTQSSLDPEYAKQLIGDFS